VIDHADGPFHQVTRANLAGFGIVVCGLLMYHVIQWRDEQRWRRDERYEGDRDECYEGRRDERYEGRRDERYEGGYEGGGDTIASVAAAEEEAAEATGRYGGAVSARCSSLALYATDDVGGGGGSAAAAAGTLCRRSAATAEASACNGPSADRYGTSMMSTPRTAPVTSSTPMTTPPRMHLLHSRSLRSVPLRSIGLSSEPGSPAPWAH
jgi:hypothetical protein